MKIVQSLVLGCSIRYPSYFADFRMLTVPVMLYYIDGFGHLNVNCTYFSSCKVEVYSIVTDCG